MGNKPLCCYDILNRNQVCLGQHSWSDHYIGIELNSLLQRSQSHKDSYLVGHILLLHNLGYRQEHKLIYLPGLLDIQDHICIGSQKLDPHKLPTQGHMYGAHFHTHFLEDT